MGDACGRREFLRTMGVASSALAFPGALLPASKKPVLLFTKSSGFEHEVIKTNEGKPSVVEVALRKMGAKHGFELTATKDGSIFDSGEFRKYGVLFFFTTGDLTKPGTDKQPPMSLQGKQAFLNAVQSGAVGFVGTHAASDTFHPSYDPKAERSADAANQAAHSVQSEPYLRMLGGEFFSHGKVQTANLITHDAKFPGAETPPPANIKEEWYSLKNFATDMHVIHTVDTSGMSGEQYQRQPYPVTWARQQGKGRVFYTAMGHLPETWENEFFLDLIAGGVSWAMGNAKARLHANIERVAPGFAKIPVLTPKK